MTGNKPRETRARAAARVSAPTGATGASQQPLPSETESIVRSTTRVLRQSFEEAMRQRREMARRNMVAALDTPQARRTLADPADAQTDAGATGPTNETRSVANRSNAWSMNERQRRYLRRRAAAADSRIPNAQSGVQDGPPMSQGEAVLMTLGSLQAMQSFPAYLLSELARNRPRMQRFGTFGNPPASEHAIENLGPALPSDALRSDICAVCQEELGSMPATSVKKMPCDHCFHETCILPWLRERNTCPVCRCQVESVCPQYNLSHRSELKGPLVPTPTPSPQDAGAGGGMGSEPSAGHSMSTQTRGDMIGLLRSAVIASRRRASEWRRESRRLRPQSSLSEPVDSIVSDSTSQTSMVDSLLQSSMDLILPDDSTLLGRQLHGGVPSGAASSSSAHHSSSAPDPDEYTDRHQSSLSCLDSVSDREGGCNRRMGCSGEPPACLGSGDPAERVAATAAAAAAATAAAVSRASLRTEVSQPRRAGGGKEGDGWEEEEGIVNRGRGNGGCHRGSSPPSPASEAAASFYGYAADCSHVGGAMGHAGLEFEGGARVVGRSQVLQAMSSSTTISAGHVLGPARHASSTYGRAETVRDGIASDLASSLLLPFVSCGSGAGPILGREEVECVASAPFLPRSSIDMGGWEGETCGWGDGPAYGGLVDEAAAAAVSLQRFIGGSGPPRSSNRRFVDEAAAAAVWAVGGHREEAGDALEVATSRSLAASGGGGGGGRGGVHVAGRKRARSGSPK